MSGEPHVERTKERCGHVTAVSRPLVEVPSDPQGLAALLVSFRGTITRLKDRAHKCHANVMAKGSAMCRREARTLYTDKPKPRWLGRESTPAGIEHGTS